MQVEEGCIDDAVDCPRPGESVWASRFADKQYGGPESEAPAAAGPAAGAVESTPGLLYELLCPSLIVRQL